MREKEMMELIQHYRHDVLNELQLVKGYLTLGKMDRVEYKLNEWIEQFNEERKLFRLNAPKWTIWLMSLNYKHKYIRLNVKLDLKNSPNLAAIDDELVAQSKQVIAWVEANGRDDELYDINIDLIEKSSVPEMILRFNINGLNDERDVDDDILGQAQQTKDGMICEWSYLVK